MTQAFNTYPVERAIEWALKGANVDYHCRSDFGFAFSQFVRTELDTLDRKTTILVLGDARNNYNDAQAWALRMMREPLAAPRIPSSKMTLISPGPNTAITLIATTRGGKACQASTSRCTRTSNFPPK